jgi:hypothetical protein
VNDTAETITAQNASNATRRVPRQLLNDPARVDRPALGPVLVEGTNGIGHRSIGIPVHFHGVGAFDPIERHGSRHDLRKLEIEISERTVSRLLAQRSRPPSQPWRAFLAKHLSAMVSMDFFTVSTLAGRVLFVLVLLAHDHRRIVHVNVTEHPTAAWTAQQLVDAFPEDSAPRWLLRDRDSIYDDRVRRHHPHRLIAEFTPKPGPRRSADLA